MNYRQETTTLSGDADESESLYTIGGNVNQYKHYETQYGAYSKN